MNNVNHGNLGHFRIILIIINNKFLIIVITSYHFIFRLIFPHLSSRKPSYRQFKQAIRTL